MCETAHCPSANRGYNAAMWLSGFYLLVNVACLAVLLHRKYASIWPLFLAFQALTCVQAGVRLVMVWKGLDSDADWMRLWAPGEYLLLLCAAAMVSESLWKSMREVPKSRPLIFFGLWVGILFGTSCLVEIYPDGSWHDKFLVYRTDFFLVIAILTFVGCWTALFYSQFRPRVERMHAGLLAALLFGHIVMVDWSRWGHSNLNYRIWEMICCAGWLINCQFLRREFSSIARKSDRAAAALLAGRQLLPGAIRHGLFLTSQADPIRSGR